MVSRFDSYREEGFGKPCRFEGNEGKVEGRLAMVFIQVL